MFGWIGAVDGGAAPTMSSSELPKETSEASSVHPNDVLDLVHEQHQMFTTEQHKLADKLTTFESIIQQLTTRVARCEQLPRTNFVDLDSRLRELENNPSARSTQEQSIQKKLDMGLQQPTLQAGSSSFASEVRGNGSADFDQLQRRMDDLQLLLKSEVSNLRRLAEQLSAKASFVAVAVTQCSDGDRIFYFDALRKREKELSNCLEGLAEFVVEVEKRPGSTLGLQVRDGRSQGVLLVDSIVPGSVVKLWNDANPSNKLLPGDQVVSVNGAVGDLQAMYAELGKMGMLRLRVRQMLVTA